jgi:hypothetical protein
LSEHKTKVLQGFIIRDEESPLKTEAEKVSETGYLCTGTILLVRLEYLVTRRMDRPVPEQRHFCGHVV